MCLFELLSYVHAAPTETEMKLVKIGIAGPMKYRAGECLWNGALLARDEINKAGGVFVQRIKRPIELVKLDTNEYASIIDATSAIEKAITVDKVDFLVGTARSEAAAAMQEIAMGYKKVFVCAAAAHPSLCENVGKDYDKFKYWFRVNPVNSYCQGQVLLQGLELIGREMKKIGIQRPKVAILAEKAVWTEPSIKATEDKAPELGLEVVGSWRPSAMATDVTPELSAIKTAGAHIMHVIVSGPVGVTIAKQWGELDIPVAFSGADSEVLVKGFWQATGGKGVYAVSMTGIGKVEQTKRSFPFWDNYLKTFGDYPGYESASYDGVWVLKEAIERANSLDSDAVVNALEETDFPGCSGRITFYPKGDKWAHDVRWGANYKTWLLCQLREDKELKVFWPWQWEGVTHKGTVLYEIPPRVKEYWKKKMR
jgi:branched-chain amino acid transport system substrate-binding protein